MERNNLENQIREKMHSREIKPSNMAWDRLDAMLSVAEQKKTKRSFGWLYIAASVLVLLSAGMFFFTQESTEITPNTAIVNQNTTKDSTRKAAPQIEENWAPIEKKQPIVQSDENALQPTAESQVASNQQPKSSTQNRVSIIKNNPSNANQSNRSSNPSIVSQNEVVFAQKQTPSNSKNESLVIEKPTTIERNEVLAQNETPVTSQSKVTVSANSLLSQVDNELDLTFREKVLRGVSKNYKEVKVAVANRNDLK